MLAVSAPRNIRDAKNVLREGRKHSAVCLSILLLWSLVIKQMMQAALIIVVLVLTNSAGSTQEEEEEQSPLPVWRVTESEEQRAPHFITVHQLVQVREGHSSGPGTEIICYIAHNRAYDRSFPDMEVTLMP